MRRAAVPLIALLLVAGCDERPHAPADTRPVQGAPLRIAKATPLPAEAAAIGDTDARLPGEASPEPPLAIEPVKPAPAPADPAPAANGDEYQELDFELLAGFECASYASTERPPVPEKILALSGRKVAVSGYMMPLSSESGGAKKFLIMRYQFGCCYAVTPKINEWIEVTMVNGVADYIPDTLDTVWGVLEVKEELRDGAAISLYKMRATKSEFTEAR